MMTRDKKNGKSFKRAVTYLCVLTQFLAVPLAYAATPPAPTALPTGGSVTSGSAAITSSGSAMTVNQSSPQTIINWGSFNIGSNASVTFNQPNGSAQALNRINSPDASQIYGSLKANGQVFLINPSGIVFGQGARVDVGALVASSKNLADSDFLNHKNNFAGSGGGAIINQGAINAAPGGYVALIGANVENAGTITAPADASGNGGKVILAAGDAVQMPLDQSGLITLNVTPSSVNASVKNDAGALVSAGGQVYMDAEAADGLVAQVLNQGTVKAPSIVLNSGGNASGTTEVSGDGLLDASNANGTGGTVTLLGYDVGLLDHAAINASGTTGGGIVRVGGDAHGGNAAQYPWADATIMAPTATIKADATGKGNGGTVVLWSRSFTNFWGGISAKGGPKGGNGGWVETSSHANLNAYGIVNAAAVQGTAGLWLLDPGNVTINAGSGTDSGGSWSSGVFTSSGTGVVYWNNIVANLGTNNVTVTTGSGAYTLTVSGAVSYASAYNLTLSAGSSVTVNGSITNTGTGGITLLAAQAATGTLTTNSAITTSGGAITLYAGLDSNGNELATQQRGSVSVNDNITSGGGNITIANGNLGIYLTSTPGSYLGGGVNFIDVTISSGTGNITVTGWGTTNSGTWQSWGVKLNGVTLAATSGNISVTGTGAQKNTNGSYDQGLYFPGPATNNIYTTTGNITLTGTALGYGATWVTGSSVGISFGGGNIDNIYSTSGNITVKGTSANNRSAFGTDMEYNNTTGSTVVIGANGVNGTGTTGNITLLGDSSTASLLYDGNTSSGTFLLKGTGALTIGSISTGNGGFTLNASGSSNGLTATGAGWSSVTLGDANTNGVTVNTALATSAAANAAVGINIASASNVTIAAALSTSAAAGIPVTIVTGGTGVGTGILTLASGGTVTTNGGLMTLAAASRFVDSSTSTALSGGQYLVWSGNASPFSGSTTDNRGGMAYNFKQYGATYGSTPVEGTGNGFLYSYQPTVTASLTGTITKTYDGTTAVTLTAANFSASGTGVNGDASSFTFDPNAFGYSAAYNTANVSATTVAANNVQFTTTNGSATVYGYLAATLPLTRAATITAATLTVTPNGTTTTYNGTALSNATYSDIVGNYTIGGWKASDTAANTSLALTGSMAFNGSTAATVKNVGSYALTQGTLGVTTSNNNYTIGFTNPMPNAYVINKAALTVVPNAVSTTYNGAALSNTTYSDTVSNYTISGLLGNDTASSIGLALAGSMAFNGSTAATVKNVGSYALTQGTLAASETSGNYTVSFSNAAANAYIVNKAALTVTPNATTTTYNGAALSNAVYSDTLSNYTVNGLQGGDTASGIGLALAGSMAFNGSTSTTVKNAGSYALTQGTLAVSETSGNYTVSFSNTAANAYVVNRAALTVVPNAVSTTYNGVALSNATYSDIVGNYTISGWQGSDTAANTSLTLAGSMAFNGSTATTVKNVGSYALTQGTLGLTASNNNYTIGFTNPTPNAYVINKAALTVVPNAVSTTYNGTALNNTTYSDTLANYAISGFQGSDTAANTNLALSGSMAFNGSISTSVKNAGSYALTQGTLSSTDANNNYIVSFSNPAPNAYVINKATLTATPNGTTATYNGTALNNAAYSDTLANYAITGWQGSDTATNAGFALTGSLAFNGSTSTTVKNVGSYALTAGTLGGTDTNGNYIVSFSNTGNNAYVINKATLTVTPNGTTATYNGAALNNTTYSDTLTNYAISGFQGSDTAANTGLALNGSLAFNGSTSTGVKNVGSYALTQGTLAVTDANGNYVIGFSNPTPNAYVINKATLTVSPNGTTTTYNGTALNNATYSDALANYTVSGFQGSDTATNTGLTLTGSLAFSGATTTIVKNAGTYALTAGTLSGSETTGNYTISFSNPSANAYLVNQAVLTPVYTASNKVYDATTTAGVTANAAASGIISGDTVAFSDALASFSDANAGTGKTVTVSGISISGASAANYTLGATMASTIANITARPITIMSDAGQTKVYGTNDPSSAATAYAVTSGSLAGTDSLSGSMGRATGENVGSYSFTQNTVGVSDGNSGSNYAITFVGNANLFTITAAPLTAAIASPTKTYGTNDPSLSGIGVTLAGQINGTVTDINGNNTVINDTSSSKVAATLTVLARAVGENVGSYAITGATFGSLSGSSATNYNAPDLAAGSALTITPANSLAVTVTASKVHGQDDPGLGSNAGTTQTVTISGAVNNASISTWNGTVAINDAVTATIPASSFTRAAGENVGSYAINLAGGGTITLGGTGYGNYVVPTSLSGSSALTITATPVGVVLFDTSKVYGQDDPSLSSIPVSYNGVINRTVATWNGSVLVNDVGSVTATVTSLTRATGENVGAYNYGTAAVTLDNANYTGTIDTSGHLTITAAPLNVSIQNQVITYGVGDPTAASVGATQTVSGVINRTVQEWNGVATTPVTINDTSSSNLSVALASLTRAAGENKGVYAYNSASFTVAGANSGNYQTPTFASGATLTISGVILTLTPVATSVTYNGTTLNNASYSDSIGHYTVAGLENGDTVSSINLTLSGSMAFGGSTSAVVRNAGTYALMQGTLSGTEATGNYTIIFSNTTNNNAYTINPLTITPVYSASNKVYDATTAAAVAANATTSGIISGDSVTFSDTSSTFANANTGTGKTVTVSGISISGAQAGNYTLGATSVTTTANITPATLTVTPIGTTMTYNGATLNNATYSAAQGNYTIAGWQGSDTASNTGFTLAGSLAFNGSTSTSVKNAGSYALTAGTLSSTDTNGDYQISFSNPTPNAYVINKATLTVSPNGTTTTYNGTTLSNATYSDTVGNYTISGWQGSDTATSAGFALTGSLAFNGSTSTGVKNAGSYALMQGTLGSTDTNGNYVVSFSNTGNNAYVINKASLTVTPNAVSTTYNGTALNNTTYSDTLTNYAISGFQGSDTTANTGLALSGAMAFNGSTSTSVRNAGSYALTQGTLAVTDTNGNYVINFSNPAPNAYVINKATLTVVPNGTTTTYNGTALNNAAYSDALANYTVSGFQGADTAAGINLTLTGIMAFNSSTTTTVKNVGSYALTQGTLGLMSNNNDYTISFSSSGNNAYVLTPATLTIVGVTANNKVYDATTAAALSTTSAALSGVWGADVVNLVSTGALGSFANDNVANGKGVTVSGFSITGADAGNYTLTQPMGLTANITSATLTYSVANARGTTGSTITPGAVTFTGVLDSDNVTGAVTAYDAANNPVSIAASMPVGSYTEKVTSLGGASAGNYIIAAFGNNFGILSVANAAPLPTNDNGSQRQTMINNLLGGNLLGGTGSMSGISGGGQVVTIAAGPSGAIVSDPAIHNIILLVAEVKIVEGVNLLDEVRFQVPEVERILSVASSDGSSLPRGVSFDGLTNVLRSDGSIPDLMLNVTARDSQGKIRQLVVQAVKQKEQQQSQLDR